ncbi:MAG TPA: TonB-dependent receptor [Terracidiphilus sp.]|nr:TonB-dependent receptor [Terracidiphilus sp.]
MTRARIVSFALCLMAGSLPAAATSAAPGPTQSGAATKTKELKSLSLEQLGNIEVTTVTKEPEGVWRTPAAIYVLTQDDIRRSGATTIPDLLRTVPGVDVAESEGNAWAVGIRGLNGGFSRDVLLLIDGRSVYTPLFEGVYWDVQDTPLEDVERIEIIRGPGGSIWGSNAVNGVINIITKHARDTQGTLATALSGRLDRFNGTVQEGLRHGNHLAYRLFVHGFDREDELNPGYDAYDRWHLVHGGFRADWTPTASDEFSAEGDIYTGDSGEQVGLGVYSPLEQLSVDGAQAISGGDLVLNWNRRFARGSDIRAQAYFDRTNRQGPQFGETRDTVDLDFIHRFQWPGLGEPARQEIIWGAGMRLSPSQYIQSQPTVNFLHHEQTDFIYSAFFQDAIELTPRRLSLIVGSKFEENNYCGFVYEPSARLLWTRSPHATLWAAFSRSVRTPGRLDQDLELTGVVAPSPPFLIRVEGDPFFKPEVMMGYEAGYRQLLTRSLYADVAAFYNRYDQLESYGTLFYSTISSPIPALLLNVPYANGIDGTTAGGEIAPDWKPVAWWELKGNFSLIHLAMHPRPGYSDTGTAAGYMGSSPRYQAASEMQFNLPHRTELDLDYRYVSSLPAQGVKAYQTADAHFGWRIGEGFAFTAAGRNLLRPEHNEFGGDNGNQVGIRRTAYAGLTWTH